jgi:hypothetical protein
LFRCSAFVVFLSGRCIPFLRYAGADGAAAQRVRAPSFLFGFFVLFEAVADPAAIAAPSLSACDAGACVPSCA